MNYLSTALEARPILKQESLMMTGDVNRDLWRNALEKTGLYQALDKLQVFENTNKLENNDAQGSSGKSSELNMAIKTSQVSHSKEVLDKHVISQKNADRYHATSVNDYSKLNALTRVDHGVLISTINHLTQSPLNPKHKVLSPPVITADQVQWLDKNALVTMKNSNMEIWLRDASLADKQIGILLKNLKQSMADLGVNLVKIAVNGRVFFERNK